MLNRERFVAHSTGKERNPKHNAALASLAQIISKNYKISRASTQGLLPFYGEFKASFRFINAEKDYLSWINENDY